MPVEETLEAFNELVEAGMVRYIAASNLSGERILESLRTSAREGLASYVALQPHYNLIERERYEREYAPIVADHELSRRALLRAGQGLPHRQVPRRRRRSTRRAPRARAPTRASAAPPSWPTWRRSRATTTRRWPPSRWPG